MFSAPACSWFTAFSLTHCLSSGAVTNAGKAEKVLPAARISCLGGEGILSARESERLSLDESSESLLDDESLLEDESLLVLLPEELLELLLVMLSADEVLEPLVEDEQMLKSLSEALDEVLLEPLPACNNVSHVIAALPEVLGLPITWDMNIQPLWHA